MRLDRAVVGFAVVTVLYVLALAWTDARGQVFVQLPTVAALLPALAGVSLLSYGVRYARWDWLLRRAGHAVPVGVGLLAYLTGFAFTATPGKLGELVRIRYFARLGVPPDRVLAAFLFERAFDLLAVLLLAGMAIQQARLFLLLVGFVGSVLCALLWLARHPGWFVRARRWLRRRRWHRWAQGVRTVQTGLAGCRIWLTPQDIAVASVLGLLAWSLTAAAFAWLLVVLGIHVPWHAAMALYPTAMLAGAASMLPAGIGSTEVTLVLLLAAHGVTAGLATVAAVAIRLASLWFSVVCGFVSLGLLEWARRRTD